MTGPLDLERFRRALCEVAEESLELGAAFRSLPAMKLPLQVTGVPDVDWDVESADPGERDPLPFDLEQGGSPRVRMAYRADGRWLVSVRAPRIVADAASMVELCQRWLERYDLLADGSDSPSGDEEGVDYRQYAEWQRSLADDGDRAGEAYWELRWAPVAGAAGQDCEGSLPHRVRRDVHWSPADADLSRELLLSCWTALLARFTGSADVELDVEEAGRDLPELRRVIGLLAECLPLRVRVEGPFQAFAGAVRDELARRADWFERLPGHETTAGRRHSASFSYLAHPTRLPSRALQVELLDVASAPSARPALYLQARRAGDRLFLELRHDATRHPDWQAARLLDGFVSLLRDAVSRPHVTVADLHLQGQAPARPSRAGARQEDGAATVHALFAEHARQNPAAIAVAGPGCRLTYGELDARSDRLAERLLSAGAGRGRAVGLCCDVTEEAVIGILAIMKSGGCYVPLDPRDPAGRLGAIAADSGIVALLTGRGVGPEPRSETAPVLAIDAGAEETGAQLRPPPSGGRDAAYVIYTSGSTGRPLGVVVEQRSLVGYLRWVNEMLAAGATIPATTRLGFDASLKQLLAPLVAGRTVALLSEAARGDAEALYEELAGISSLGLNCVPGLWSELLEIGSRDAGRRLAAVLVRLMLGGERVPADLMRTTAELFPAAEVWNLYGPTEATANACAGLLHGGRPVRIGAPLPSATAHVLDHLMRPVPAGFPGTLFIGGAGVARGYLGAPAATAGRFRPDPFSGVPGSRLYDSGDLVRADDTGTLEYLGRRDFQVKVRGFRVEIEDVEAALRACAGVAEAAVVPVELTGAGTQLVACVSPKDIAGLSVEAVKREVAGRLPHYMVPSTLRVVGELPRTSAGKLDRAALRLLAAAGDGAAPDEACESETETALAEMWGTLLGRPPVSPSAHFFDLGGHSLLVVKLTWRVREAFGVDLAARALFDHPVLRDYARTVESARALPGARPDPIPEIERGGPLPVSFAQHRFWFLNRLDPTSPVHNILAVRRISGTLDLLRLQRAIDTVMSRHEVLRMRFVNERGRPMQVPEARVSVPLTLVDVSDLSGDEQAAAVQRQVAAACGQPFDLKQAPPLRLVLVRTGDHESVLALVVHHVVADGRTKGLFFDDLASAYAGLEPPAPVPVAYADYAAWQRARVLEGALEDDLAYWRRQLADLPAARLPGGRGSRSGRSHEGARVRRELSRETTARIRQLAARLGATTFMTVLAAFQALLHGLTGGADVAVGTPVDGRDRRELQDSAGCFSSTLVLRADLGGDPTFGELVGRVRATALDAHEHAAVPLEVHGAVARSAGADEGRAPLIQFLFAMLPEPARAATAGPLTWTEVDVDGGLSEHDLSLSVRDAGDQLELYLTYRKELFSREDAAGLLDWLGATLDTVGGRPEVRLSGLGGPDLGEAAAADDRERSGETLGALQAIWRELFERESIDVDDDFFALGGHSLTALIMVERVEEAFGVELPLSEVFEQPTVGMLAGAIERLRASGRAG